MIPLTYTDIDIWRVRLPGVRESQMLDVDVGADVGGGPPARAKKRRRKTGRRDLCGDILDGGGKRECRHRPAAALVRAALGQPAVVAAVVGVPRAGRAATRALS